MHSGLFFANPVSVDAHQFLFQRLLGSFQSAALDFGKVDSDTRKKMVNVSFCVKSSKEIWTQPLSGLWSHSNWTKSFSASNHHLVALSHQYVFATDQGLFEVGVFMMAWWPVLSSHSRRFKTPTGYFLFDVSVFSLSMCALFLEDSSFLPQSKNTPDALRNKSLSTCVAVMDWCTPLSL